MTYGRTSAPSGIASFSTSATDFLRRNYVPQETRHTRLLLCMLLWSVLSFFFTSRYVIATVEVDGESMEPTLVDSERHLVHRWSLLVREPRRSELVVLKDHIDDAWCIKRVIGLPGDVIEFREGGVRVNGAALDEPYLAFNALTVPQRPASSRVTVGEGRYFVMGDNRANSVDSRTYGTLRRADLLGVVNVER